MAAHVRAYDAVDRINFEGKIYRTDIADPSALAG
jgi:phosphoribosylamine-glycine ligase